MQVRFCLKMVLKSRDLRNFAITNSFYEMHAVVQFENKQTLFLEKKSLNVPAVKLFSKNKFNIF